jgi:hypothetical protein
MLERSFTRWKVYNFIVLMEFVCKEGNVLDLAVYNESSFAFLSSHSLVKPKSVDVCMSVCGCVLLNFVWTYLSSCSWHGVEPLVDPFQSHLSKSLFVGLPWFLLPFVYLFIYFKFNDGGLDNIASNNIMINESWIRIRVWKAAVIS